MRDHVFRGKRKDNGQWTHGDLIQLLGEQGQGRKFIVDNRFGACIDNEGNFVNTEAPFVNEVDPETVGQYTGLKDAKNTELYRHDLWEYHNVVYIVSWHPDEARFYFKHPNAFASDDDNIELQWATHGTMVGNIHDNPELLGEVRE